jgi:small subunit ribosomal protein S14
MLIHNYNKLWNNNKKKQIYLRKKFKSNELFIIFYKKLLASSYLNFFKNKFLLKIYSIQKLKKNSFSVIKDRCIITGRSRGLIKDFKISRLKFKEFSLKGLLPNIKKQSW